MSEYQITCYCYNCNGGNDETKSGEPAREGYTAACHPNKYKNLKNKKINIEGVGERYIKDTYRKTLPENRIDVYVGNTGKCTCDNNSINGMRKVTFN